MIRITRPDCDGKGSNRHATAEKALRLSLIVVVLRLLCSARPAGEPLSAGNPCT
jgi:hypothetical protein